MRFLKFVGGVFGVLVAFLLFLAFFIKDHAETQQKIFIKTAPQTVFRLVSDLHNWKSWSPFMEGDNDLNSVFTGPERGLRSKHVWKGKNGRGGSQEIVACIPYESIRIKLDMGGSGQAFDEWTFKDTTGGVIVGWKLVMKELSYPFHRYFGYFIEGTMKPLQERGLQKMKELAEGAPPAIPIEVIEKEIVNAVAILDSALMPDVEQKLADDYLVLGKLMASGRVSAEGPPFAVFYNWDAHIPIKFRVALPVAEEVREHGLMHRYCWEAGKMLKAVHRGPAEGLENVHIELDNYMQDHGMKLKGAGVYEVYLKQETEAHDSLAIVTEVYYPIELNESNPL